MSESSVTPEPIKLPEKTPERLAEIQRVLERARRGDFTGLIPWEEVATELGLLSNPRRA
jgi:hypothetical protein